MSVSGAVRHWWAMRVTSALLAPLTVWLIWAGVNLAGANHADAVAFMSIPANALAAFLLAAAGLYHSVLGIEEVIEDYVPGAGLAALLTWVTRIGCFAGLIAVSFALYLLIFGA
jgi:succinate dehydrogenase / fumarate reductase membrane anchor subunit